MSWFSALMKDPAAAGSWVVERDDQDDVRLPDGRARDPASLGGGVVSREDGVDAESGWGAGMNPVQAIICAAACISRSSASLRNWPVRPPTHLSPENIAVTSSGRPFSRTDSIHVVLLARSDWQNTRPRVSVELGGPIAWGSGGKVG